MENLIQYLNENEGVLPFVDTRPKVIQRIKLSPKTRFDVLHRDGFKCQYCGKSSSETTLEIDHIIPLSRGGTNDKNNLITSCKDCNLGKLVDQIIDNEKNNVVKMTHSFLKTDDDVFIKLILAAIDSKELFIKEFSHLIHYNLRLNVNEFSRKTNIPVSTVYKLLSGRREPNIKTLRLIINSLKKIKEDM